MTWLAYYSDFSEFAVFDEEIDALRYAVDNEMKVMRIKFGEGVREQVRGA